jgi:YidC/Oxa1 family membrane protein insertase
MEQVRMLLAIALSFLVFFLWNLFFVDSPETPPVREETAGAPLVSPQDQAGSTQAIQKKGISSPLPAKEFASPAAQPARVISVRTPLYTVNISEKGAVFESYVLTHYNEKATPGADQKELIPSATPNGMFALEFTDKNINRADQGLYVADTDTDTISVTDRPETISFTWQVPTGFVVRKTFTFMPESYVVGMDVTLENQATFSAGGDLVVVMQRLWEDQGSRYGFEGPCAFTNGRMEKVEVGDLDEQNRIAGALQWAAVQDRYFLSSIIPVQPGEAALNLAMSTDNVLSARYTTALPENTPGQTVSAGFEIYMGPKSVPILKQVGYDLDQAVNFGFFNFIAKPCLWLMNFFYGYIPNYGIAIILLTVLVKIVFWPLGNKSYKSMNEMKKLQPLMAEMREKYKDDKKRMNEEVMGLYRTYKINPLGGCLPMVAQIPVFFALYQMLYGAIELRHAPFFGWIADLSAPDRLFDFAQYGVTIPLMEPPFGIPVLTIVMGATMLIQQKLQPPAGDPTQAKMMMMMPIVFTVIFINFSSGLVLYWLINNILSIAQQYYVSRKNA